MATYKTPGVYVEEIATFPPSVAEVSTAIPAFIGYTAAGKKVARINTLLEYETLFGKAPSSTFTAKARIVPATNLTELIGVERTVAANAAQFLMYYSLSLYFKNGGGSCYIVSVGDYAATPSAADFEAGLTELAKEDEPTLILLTDAVNLSADDYYTLCNLALAQCGKLGDRFTLVDVLNGEVATARDKIGTANLCYGAAYHPYLQTALTYAYEEEQVTITAADAPAPSSDNAPANNQPANTPTLPATLTAARTDNTALYNQIKSALAQQRVVLPPSPAIAGVYATVDRERGVWKAPANVSLTAVIGPTHKITHDDQEDLNIDPNAGKSINAIRAFTGKGTLVWGARTLAGNDNEWRYISVRRLFNLIEESTQKATAFAVFEPNDAATWLKVKAMIESYLYGLWEQGALAGSTPEAAYFVQVGLGKTMTAQDVLEGRMIVEIGIAAVRPAEFIVLRFTHKLQEA
ncbi:MAG: phage tail sheath C-terminal domain-containing protein [Caldilineaceae bacterium]